MNLSKHLADLADRLDKDGKIKSANAVDNLLQSGSLEKVAQYVGAIGYVLKQERAMANCIRQKRVSSSGPMQEVIMDCLKEYQDSQSYDDREWTSKYASSIKSSPDQFHKLHLYYLSQLSEENNISEHINNIVTASKCLKEENETDSTISEILTSAEQAGELIKKEASFQPPFKLAALPSVEEELSPSSEKQKGFWSRLFSPSKYQWWNPLSWDREESGPDSEVSHLMSDILQNLTNMAYTVQNVKLNTAQIKTEILRSSHDDDTKAIAAKLTPDRWAQNNQALHDLHDRIKDPKIMSIASDIENGVGYIFEHLKRIQSNMRELRRNPNVTGKDIASDDTSRRNTLTSPTQEFDYLQRVMNKLYVNPLDEEAIYQAQRMHSRLDDRLRGIRQNNWTPEDGPDKAIIDWYHQLKEQGMDDNSIIEEVSKGLNVSKFRTREILTERGVFSQAPSSSASPSDSKPEQSQQSQPPLAEPQPSTTSAPVSLSDENRNTLKRSFDALMSNFEGTDQEKAQKILDVLSFVKTLGLTNPEAMAKIEAMELFAAEKYKNINTPPAPEPEIPTADNAAVMPETDKPEQITETVPPQTATEPNATPVPANAPAEEFRSIFDDEDDAIAERIHQDLVNRKRPKTSNNWINSLIKVADTFDTISPDIADLIDNYIENMVDEKFPEFPNVSNIISEK